MKRTLLILATVLAAVSLMAQVVPFTFLGLRPASGAAMTPTPVDFYFSGNGPEGVTNSLLIMSNQTYEATAGGAWAFNPAGAGTNMDFHADGLLWATNPFPISVNSVTYTGAEATNGFRLSIATIATIENRKTINPTNVVFVAFYFKCSPEADFASADLWELRGQNGTVHATAQWRSNPQTYMAMHTDDAASVSTEHVPTTNGAIYRVLIKADLVNKIGSMSVWNPTNRSLIGISTLAMGSNPVSLVIGPQVGNHGQTSPTSPYFYYSKAVGIFGTNSQSVSNYF